MMKSFSHTASHVVRFLLVILAVLGSAPQLEAASAANHPG